MRSMTTEFDYFVLVTGNSRRQLHAISEEIDRVLEKELGVTPQPATEVGDTYCHDETTGRFHTPSVSAWM